jgi:hypothetical protein
VPSPIAVLDKHAAVGYLVIGSDEPGAPAGTSAILTEWQSAKVQRVALTRTGSTYAGSVSPFLSGIRNPLAIAAGPGRSLLVGDWASGTIYLIKAKETP